MIYTAFFQSTVTGEFSRSITFNASFDRQKAWEKASNMSPQNEYFESDYLFCLIAGSHEAWTPDLM